MGATGLFAYINNKAAGAAQQTTLRPTEAADDECRSNEESSSQPPPPRRVVLIDANGLYHHLLYKFFPSAARSTGGDFRAMHTAASQFLAPFLQPSLRIAVAVVFDGTASSSEGKSATRLQRARDRRDKMRRFDVATRMRMASPQDDDSALPLPVGCVDLNAREETLLPVPSGCLLAFRQSLHALGISTWNADGENDEYLAALAVGIAAVAREEGRTVEVDIIGQDSDFLVFDTRINDVPAAATASSAAAAASSSSASAQDDACAYVPLDALRFEPLDCDSDESEEAGFAITFRRYTTTAVSAALKLPACLLPSVACLVGNDSALDLAHFHCFTHSGSFLKLVRESSAGSSGSGGGAGVSSNNRFAALTSGKGSRNTNASSVEFNGGFNTSSQLVEAVLAFVSSVARTHGCSAAAAAAAGSATGALSSKQHREHLDAMAQVIQRMFGEDASAPPRGSLTTSDRPLRASALDAFRRAQLKYSLARFFQSQHSVSADASELLAEYGVFDPGFAVDSDGAQAAASTAILLPRPLLALYHSAHLSPVLLSILLTRHYVSHVTLGDVVHPCCFHTQRAAGEIVDEGGVCAKALWESRSDECFCRSAAECTAGVRRRIHLLLLVDPAFDLKPRSLPSNDELAEAGVGASVSAIISSIGRGVTSLFRPAAAAASSTSSSSAAASSVLNAESITIWECLQVASVSDRSSIDEDAAESSPANEHVAAGGERWVQVQLHQSDAAALLATITEATKASCKLQPLPPVFPELAVKNQDAGWMTLLALLDSVADLPLAAASKLPAASARLHVLRSSLAPLAHLHAPLAVFTLVVRQVFLHALAPLLAHRFEPPAIGAKVDATISAQMRRAIMGLNALVIQAALMLTSSSEFEHEDEDAKPEYLSLEALSLSQLFMECYHWSEYAVQATRLRSHLLHAATGESAAESPSSAGPSSSIAAHPSPLLPLFRCFDGVLFHRVYVQLLEAIERPATESKGAKKKGKNAAAAKFAHAAPASSSSCCASAAASSKSAPSADFSLCSPALSNALLDLDAAVVGATEALLLTNIDGADSANVAQARSLISALKTALFGTIGLNTHASPSAIDAGLAQLLVQSSALESGERVQPRFVLPFETFQAEPGASLRFAAEGSTFFSLCSASVPLRSASAPHHTPCASCGLRGVDVPHPSMSPSADEDGSGSDADAAFVESKAAAKGKRKRKTKGKSKR